MKSNALGLERFKNELVPTRVSLLARLKDLEDQASWKQFFDTYYRLLYSTVARRGVPAHETEDVVAEIVEGVARGMPEFVYDPKQCSFKTWLFRIVERRVADYFRRRGRALPCIDADADAEELQEVPDPATLEPDKKWDTAWEENLIQAALDRVRHRANPRYLQIYIYSVLEGHSVADTARDLQTTVNDVSVAKHRIEKMLQEEGERLRKEEKLREQLQA